jgi:hypothetical protein
MGSQTRDPSRHANPGRTRSSNNKPFWFRASCGAFAMFLLFVTLVEVRSVLGLVCGIGTTLFFLAVAFGWR